MSVFFGRGGASYLDSTLADRPKSVLTAGTPDRQCQTCCERRCEHRKFKTRKSSTRQTPNRYGNHQTILIPCVLSALLHADTRFRFTFKDGDGLGCGLVFGKRSDLIIPCSPPSASGPDPYSVRRLHACGLPDQTGASRPRTPLRPPKCGPFQWTSCRIAQIFTRTAGEQRVEHLLSANYCCRYPLKGTGLMNTIFAGASDRCLVWGRCAGAEGVLQVRSSV